MINEVDESLRQLLFGELSRIDGTSITDASQITFLPPTTLEETAPKKAAINVFLHDVRENVRMRDHEHSLVTRGPNSETVTRQRAPIRLDLAYLVTVYAANDPMVEHRLLTEVLGVLLRAPMLPARYLTQRMSEDSEGGVMLAVAQPDQNANTDPPKLWQAMGGKLRPTIGLIATAAFNPYETRVTRLVREAVLALGPGIPPNGPKPLSLHTTRVSAAGIVCNAEGTELAGIEVQAKGFDKKVRTDDRGFFYLLDLPAGRVTLVFRGRGMKTVEIPTNVPPIGRPDLLEPLGVTMANMDDAELVGDARSRAQSALEVSGLVESGREVKVGISGRLAYPSGTPAAFVVVKAGKRETTTDNDGFYAFNDLKEKVTSIIAVVPGVGEVPVTPSDATTVLASPNESEKPAKAKR